MRKTFLMVAMLAAAQAIAQVPAAAPEVSRMDGLAFAELDPEPFRNEAAKLSEGLCRRDAGACPRTRDWPGHSHISEIAHLGASDDTAFGTESRRAQRSSPGPWVHSAID